MVKLIEAGTRLDAWMMGAEYLLRHDAALNLLLAIEFPTRGSNDPAATERIDEFLAAEEQLPTHSWPKPSFLGPSTCGAVSGASS